MSATSILGRASVLVGADTSKFQSMLRGPVESIMQKVGISGGSKMAKAIGVGMAGVAIGAAVTKGLYNIGHVFDEVSDTIRVGTGATGEALEALETSAKNVGKNIPAAFEDVGTTIADVNTRLGLTGPTLETLSSQILEAGRIMGEEIDINKLSASFNAFRIEGEDTTAAMDHLYRVSQATGVGINELAANVSSNAPAVQALGFTFEETAALVGNLDKAGLNSSKMMMGLSRGLVEVAKAGEEPQEAFRRVVDEMQGFIDSGDKASAIDLASSLFGTRNATQFIGALESGALAMDDLAAVAGMTEDTILGASKETMSFGEQWQIFKNKGLAAIEPIATRVFDLISDGMAWINDVGVPAFERFTDEWSKGVGTGGQFRDAMQRVWDVLKPIGAWLWENKTTVGIFVGALAGFMVVRKVTAAFKAFNLVLRANPIGLVVTAIAGLVAGLVWLYNNNETARAVIDKAWTGIKTAISAVADWITGTAWPVIQNVWEAISSGAMWLWENGIKPAWEGIKGGVETVVDWLRNTAWPFVKDVFDKIGKAAEFLYVNFIRPQWILISKIIETVVNWVKNTGWPWLRDAFGRIGEKAKEIYEKWIKPAWDGIKSGIDTVVTWLRDTAWPIIKTAWDNIADGAKVMWEKWIKPAFDNFKSGIDVVVGAVDAAKTAISNTWSKITGAITGPLDRAKAFINDKFIKPLNKMFETLKMSFRIPLISVGSSSGGSGGGGGPMLAMASGGVVPGFSPHPKADNIPIWATAGEFMLPVNATKRLMSQVGSAGMEMLRRGQIPGYALGGLVDWAKEKGSAAVGWVKEKGTDIIDLASKAWDVISNPMGYLRDFASKALAGIGESPFAQAMAAGARRIIDSLVAKVKEWVGSAGGGDRGGNNMGWRAMKAWFEATFPGQRITSGYRPGAVSITGIKSDHALGRAIDMPPSMAIFNTIDRTWKNIRQLLYSPAGPRQIRGGRRSDTIGSPLRAQHWDHVHWAMAQGGLVKPFVADQGVVLKRGLNLLDNRTGKPEPLARTDQQPTIGTLKIDLRMEDLRDLDTLRDFLEMLKVQSVMIGGTNVGGNP